MVKRRALTKKEKAGRIAAILDEKCPLPPIPLAHDDPFTLLVAVVLSAQTTDARVNLVTPALFSRASTPSAMAKLKESEILGLIRTCGLSPAKAKYIKALSQKIIRDHAGQVPKTLEELERLPGVGHKTASVVISQAFGEPAFPVDTHIHRLAWRWGLSGGRRVAQTERDLCRLFPRDSWGKVHLQIIQFGRTYCPAIGHDPARCPICSWSMSRNRGLIERRRRARSRRKKP